MNRTEAFEHFKQRLADPKNHGNALYAASAYVTAGILTNSDYAKLCALANPAPKKPFTPKKPKKRMKWDVVVDGRHGLRRIKGRDPATKLQRSIIEWIDPEPTGWMQLQLAKLKDLAA